MLTRKTFTPNNQKEKGNNQNVKRSKKQNRGIIRTV